MWTDHKGITYTGTVKNSIEKRRDNVNFIFSFHLFLACDAFVEKYRCLCRFVWRVQSSHCWPECAMDFTTICRWYVSYSQLRQIQLKRLICRFIVSKNTSCFVTCLSSWILWHDFIAIIVLLYYSVLVREQSTVISLSVCLSVCLWAYLWNHSTDLHEICYADSLWPWLVPSLATLQYIMYFRFCGWRHVWL